MGGTGGLGGDGVGVDAAGGTGGSGGNGGEAGPGGRGGAAGMVGTAGPTGAAGTGGAGGQGGTGGAGGAGAPGAPGTVGHPGDTGGAGGDGGTNGAGGLGGTGGEGGQGGTGHADHGGGAALPAGDPTQWTAQSLQAMKDAGMTWIRIEIGWQAVEWSQGTLDWSYIDPMVNLAQGYGFKILGLVTYAPDWATTGNTPTMHGSPTDPTQFAEFASAAATHYQGKINAWEVWNEPNIREFWGPTPDVARYATLLEVTYQAIKAVDPSSTVLSGGLSSAGQITPLDFVEGLNAIGANKYLDGVALHPYTFPELPNVAGIQSITSVHDVMQKQVWLTEFGAPTGTAPYAAVSTTDQATAMAQVLSWEKTTPWAGPVFVYDMVDAGTDPNNIMDNFGLLDAAGNPKPAYLAVKNALVANL
jgi:hypothetical protein